MDYINIGLRSYMIILFTSTLSFIEASNINCNGKAFNCVNSTHFKICVDLGGGVSTTVDEFLIPCPQNTVCKPDNIFECEYELTTTPSPVIIQAEVRNEQFQTSDNPVSTKLDITTLFPTTQPQGMELSEKYYEVNTTPASFTKKFTDAVISPLPTINPNDLHTSVNSEINKSLDLNQSTDKVLRFSSTESGMNVTEKLPYNDTLVTSIGVTNYNTESPIFFSITNDTKSIDPIKDERLEPLNKNSSDLDARLTITKRTDQVSSVSEVYSASATLLPENFTDPSVKENAPLTSNINRLIRSENTSQEPNLDLLITYNKTQLNNSDNNTQYRNFDINKQNSTTLNVITDKILTSDNSNINNKSKINTAITPEPLGQHLDEITTASTIKVPEPTNLTSDITLNAADAFETDLSITTNFEKISITDRDIMISTSTIQPETSVVMINDMVSKITKSVFNNDVSSVALTNPIINEYSTTPSNKPQRLKSIPDFPSKNETTQKPVMSAVATDFDNNDITIEKPSNNITVEISNGITSLEPISDLISKNETLLNQLMSTVVTDIDDNNIITTELSNNVTVEISNGVKSLKSKPDLITKNVTLVKPVTAVINLDNNNVTTTEVSNNTTSEIPNGVKSLTSIPDLILNNETLLKPVTAAVATNLESNNITVRTSNAVKSLESIPDSISMNETRLEPFVAAVATDLDNNNVTTTKVSNNITADISNGAMRLKSIQDLISKNETLLKPVVAAFATDLESNNVTTTEVSNNIKGEIFNGVTSLKPIKDIISKNETRLKPVMVAVSTDDNNNITITEVSNNIKGEISNGAKSLKSIQDLISKNETLLKPVVAAVATDLVNNNVTTTKVSYNITADISDGAKNLESVQDLISKNETLLKPVVAAVATDLDNNNVTTTKVSYNITADISDGTKNLESVQDLISKNVTLLKPVVAAVATDLDTNNVTTTEVSNSITVDISDGAKNLESVQDLISKNETLLKPVVAAVATDLDNNNVTTTKVSYNITADISDGAKNLESVQDLISKNETLLKPVVAAVATDLDNNNNVTTTEVSNSITVDISDGAKNLESVQDLISKNETLLNPVVAAVATDLDTNNVTTTEVSNSITVDISDGAKNLESVQDLISKNETLLKPVVAAVATDLDNNNVTTTKVSYNITADISDGAKNLESVQDLISKNETLLKPVVAAVATDLDNNNNVTTTEVSNSITVDISDGAKNLESVQDLISKNETLLNPVVAAVATDLDTNNVTTTEVSNSITADIFNGAKSLKSIQDLISKNETLLKPVVAAFATDLDTNNVTTTEVSNNIKGEIFNGVTSLKPIKDIISKNETKLKPVMVAVSTDDNNNITITEVRNNMTVKTSNTVTSLKPIKDIISKNETRLKPVMVAVSTDDNNNITITEVRNNMTVKTSNTVTSLKSIQDVISKNETLLKPVVFAIATDLDNNNVTTTKVSSNITADISNGVKSLKSIQDLISKNETLLKPVVSAVATDLDNNNVTTTKSTLTTKHSTYFDTDMYSKPVISLEANTATSELVEEYNTKKEIHKITSNNDQILDKNSFGNQTLTKRKTENILLPKLRTTTDFSLSPALNLTDTNNNITDKNSSSLKDTKLKHNRDTNSLSGQSLTVGVIKTDLNFSIPFVNLRRSLTKSPLPDIYNTSHSYFRENISQTGKFDRTTASNKFHETEGKESIQTNKNVLVNAISNIKHEGNKSLYLELYPYKQGTKTAIKINDNTLKESHNFSDPSLTMENITTVNKNTTPKYSTFTKVSSYNKSNSTTTIKTVNGNNCTNSSKVADYSRLSNIPNRQLSGKTLLIVHEPLQEVNNITNVHIKNGYLSLKNERGFQGHDSVGINKSEINNKQTTKRSEFINSVNNITKIVDRNILNNGGVVNTMVGATANKTFIHDRNVSEVKSLSVIRTKENATDELYFTSESSITANNLLRNTSSQTNSIKNKIHTALPSNVLEISRKPSEFYKSSQPTEHLKLETTTLVTDTKKIEIIRKQEKITIFDHAKNGNEKKQIRNDHFSPQSILTIGNAVTKNIRNITQNILTTPIRDPPKNQEFSCTKRGKFSDAKDCHKFYVCIGRGKPIIGVCPTNTVFSEYLKQCTKNVTHCIRNNQFKCTASGRFINILCNNSYFICAKKNAGFIRFTLHCQKGYYLDKNNIKCAPELKNISISDESSSKNTKDLSFDNSKEKEVTVKSKNVFECEKEGKFNDPQDCRTYYVCKKGRKSIFRRKIKKCDSDEVFHRKKKKCVDVESYDCDI